MESTARPASASAQQASADSATSAQARARPATSVQQPAGRPATSAQATARPATSVRQPRARPATSVQQPAARPASAFPQQAVPRPATLEVAALSHGRVRINGLARFFLAHTVHIRRSTAVVAANDCKLQSVDHYHIRRVSVSLDPLLKRGSPGRAALQHLLKDRSPSGIARFQQAMRGLASPAVQQDTQTSLPVRVDHNTWVTSATGVQYGDGSRMNVKTHCVVEESELPIVDLLARHTDLVHSLLNAVDEPQAGPATQRFLRDTLRSAGCVDDLDLLDHSTGLSAPDTSIFGLFGVDVVGSASAAMVGSGNQLRTDMRVHRAGVRTGTILADLGHIRAQNPVRGPVVAQPRSASHTPSRPNPGPRNVSPPSGSASSLDDRGFRPGRSFGPF